MNTPDLTLEDLTGATAGLGILIYTKDNPSELVQLAGVILAGLSTLAIIICGTTRRGNRAKNLVEQVHFLDTGAQEEE
jgi:hypothetical protein